MSKAKPANEQARIGAAVDSWNAAVRKLARDAMSRHASQGLVVEVLSTFDVFRKVRANPKAYNATKGLRYVDGDCKSRNCGNKASEYFWFDNLHPGTKVHEAVAVEAANVLKDFGRKEGCDR